MLSCLWVAEVLACGVQFFVAGSVLHCRTDFLQHGHLMRLRCFDGVDERFGGLVVATQVHLELRFRHHEVGVNGLLCARLVDEAVEAFARLAEIGGDARLRKRENIPQVTFGAHGICLRRTDLFVSGCGFFPVAVYVCLLSGGKSWGGLCKRCS